MEIPSTIKDLTGYKFGKGCYVISLDRRSNKRNYWLVKCGVCNNNFITESTNFTRTRSPVKECKECASSVIIIKNTKDITGQVNVNGIKCLKYCESGGHGAIWWIECTCGRIQKCSAKQFKSMQSCKKCFRLNLKNKPKVDFTGKKFESGGEVIKYLGHSETCGSTWLYKCACGKICKKYSKGIRGGGEFCRKCSNRIMGENSRIDLTGMRFDYLTVVQYAYSKNNVCYWQCDCKCGNKTNVTSCSLRAHTSTSCGCKLKRTGSDSPNWNHNLSIEDRILRGRANSIYFNFIKRVYKKYNYTCKMCERRRVKIHAHHLDGWHWCEDGRYDINNMVVLCEHCHKNFHKIFGCGNNTKEQFHEFTRMNYV